MKPAAGPAGGAAPFCMEKRHDPRNDPASPPVRILADELLTELDAETSEQPTVFGFTMKEAAQTSATTLRREQAQEALPTRVAEMEELLVMRKAAMIERIDAALQRSKQEVLHG